LVYKELPVGTPATAKKLSPKPVGHRLGVGLQRVAGGDTGNSEKTVAQAGGPTGL